MSRFGIRGLHARLTWTLVGIAAGVLVLATLVMLVETHHHFAMYENQMQTSHDHDLIHLNSHIEMALVQSILWTALGALLIAIVVSYLMAKRLTAPLVGMRRVAERMAEGQLEARTEVVGEDEVAELGRTLNWLAEQLQAQESLRKTMSADIAHELRTPLTTLKSHMEAFEDGVWQPTPARIRSCYEEIERLIHLVRDLEHLTHMESPDFTLRPPLGEPRRRGQKCGGEHPRRFLPKRGGVARDTPCNSTRLHRSGTRHPSHGQPAFQRPQIHAGTRVRDRRAPRPRRHLRTHCHRHRHRYRAL